MSNGSVKPMEFDLMIENETALSVLYQAFEKALPAEATFWHQLVIEERAHADVLRSLATSIDGRTTVFVPKRFAGAVIKTSLDYVNQQIDRVHSEGTTMLRALSLALNIEQSIIENRFFEVVESDSVQMKEEFEELKRHTMAHEARIRARWEQLRGVH